MLGLSLTTPHLELRLPTDDELAELAEVAAQGIHAGDYMPFVTPWTIGTPREVARSVIRSFWRRAAEWEPDNWNLGLAVFKDGRPIGVQSMRSKNFAITREVTTGSWLGLAHQGQGYGTQMRVAILELAFTGLGAESAVSGALMDNEASLAVSRKLGYRLDGINREIVQGTLRLDQRLRLDRLDWRAPFSVPIKGLDVSEFGL
ncbi:putative succinyl-CoA transferase [Rhizocola hellebori]|uniref:Putative succinyl-CoA transferase n=2 Tax=Rhizocola hellebori TaxID=1392758 RepID=A0A8J3Q868_9ACTN|nr:putative succinyl-CoA transferase [Rhizocola hellebori]